MDTVNGPRYFMLAVTSRGNQVPYPDGDTAWVTRETSGYYADSVYGGGVSWGRLGAIPLIGTAFTALGSSLRKTPAK